MDMLSKPLRDLTAWTRHFAGVDIPVLRETSIGLDQLRLDLERVSPRQVAECVIQDPLMALKVLAWISGHRGKRQLTDIETIEPAIVMMGVPPFFHNFEILPVVEEHLQDYPEALQGLMAVVERSFRAAHYARDWALLRRDLDTEVVIIATLLHDFAELLLWSFAPELALRIQAMKRATPGLRTATAQREVLGVTLDELELALMRAWQLPELLQTITDNRHPDNPQVKNVIYAVNLARHSASGWDDPALPDDYRDVAALLHMTPGQVQDRVVPPHAHEN